MTQKGNKVTIEMHASPLAGEQCLHRDNLEVTSLQEEIDLDIMQRDNLFFKNLEALESTLTVATFDEQGVAGTWKVSQDDLYESQSMYKDFFMLSDSNASEHTEAYVIYKLKDYDYVGPDDFHEDRRFDILRDSVDSPWLSIDIKFYEAGQKRKKEDLELQLSYRLD